MIAGVELKTAPSGWRRTKVMSPLTSHVFM